MNLPRSEPAAFTSVPIKKSVQRKADSPSARAVSKSVALKNIDAQPSNEQIALRAYFIGERRRNLGIPGDETSDWVEAEREISEELKAHSRLFSKAPGRRPSKDH
jgi:Protein of unknown function (DUF2934)